MPRMRRGLVMMASARGDRTFTRRPQDGSKPRNLLEQSGSELHIHILVCSSETMIGSSDGLQLLQAADIISILVESACRSDPSGTTTNGDNVSAIEKENVRHVWPRSWLDARVQPPCIPLVCWYSSIPCRRKTKAGRIERSGPLLFCHNRIPTSFKLRSCRCGCAADDRRREEVTHRQGERDSSRGRASLIPDRCTRALDRSSSVSTTGRCSA